MSTEKMTAEYFSEVIDRLMLALNVHNEYEIAAFMGFKKDTFSARKKRGALPEDKIKILCADKSINLNWVMTGNGEQDSNEPRTQHAQAGPFPKELDFDLLMKVTAAVEDIAEKRGVSIDKDRQAKVTMLAYTDTFWRKKVINQEYLEHLVEVSASMEAGLSKERVFLEVSGGYLIAENLPKNDGWLDGISVIEISAEKKDDIDSIAGKIFQKLGIKPVRGGEQRGRQLRTVINDIFQKVRHLIIVINDAHLLSKSSLSGLKWFHEQKDFSEKVPGIILIGSLNTLISVIADTKEIALRCIQINEQGQLVGLGLPLADYMIRK